MKPTNISATSTAAGDTVVKKSRHKSRYNQGNGDDDDHHDNKAKSAANNASCLVRGEYGNGNGNARETLSSSKRNIWLLAILSAVLLLVCQGQESRVEAKLHHSKRQAPLTLSSSTTGRENINWWNIWWQQYIDEAVQPTVRPIVGVSFNGHSINLSDQSDSVPSSSSLGVASSSQLEADNSDATGKLVQPHSDLAANALELERSGRLQLVASSVTGKATDSGQPTQEQQLQRSRSLQQQSNWQSVRPTMILAPPQSSAASTNMRADLRAGRQAAAYQPQVGAAEELAVAAEEPQSTQLGIQMRSVMGNSRSQQPQRQVPPPNSFSSSSANFIQQQQQQQPQQPFEFEQQQQQNQMVDYAEEGEPELDSGEQTSRGPTTGRDSSSSSMMMEQPEPQRTTASRVSPSSQTQQAEDGSTKPPQPSQPMILIPGKKQSTVLQQQPQSTTMGSTSRVMPNQRTLASTTPRPETGEQPTAPTTTAASVSTTTGTQMTATIPPATTTAATSTPAKPSSASTINVDLNETPISFESNEQQQQQAESTPTGRVELTNGRPASGIPRLQGTTTSARLPTGKSKAQTGPDSSTGKKTTQAMGTASSGSSASGTTPASPTTISAAMTTTTTTTMPAASSTQAAEESFTTTMAPQQASSKGTGVAVTGTSTTSSPSATMDASTQAAPASKQPTTAAPSMNVSTEAGGDSTESDSDDSESDEADSMMMGNTASSSEDSDDSSSSDDDSSDDEADQEPTTTTRPTASTSQQQQRQQQQQPASSNQGQGTPSRQAVSTSLPPDDIERLPKSQTTPGRTASSASTTKPPPSVGGSSRLAISTTGQAVTSMTTLPGSDQPDITRIRPAPSTGSQADFGMMISLDQGKTAATATTISGDTPITMPMETLMELMMNRMSSSSSPSSSSSSPLDESPVRQSQATTISTTQASPTATTKSVPVTTTTTTLAPTTTASSVTSKGVFTNTTGSDSTTMTSAGPRTTSSREQESAKLLAMNELGSTGPRKKLQPPPATTRAPGSSQSDQSLASPMAAGDSTMTTSKAPAATPQMQQRLSVMFNSDQSGLSSVAPNNEEQLTTTGSFSAPAGGDREPKIEMLNLDLMPIQRIMSQNQLPPVMKSIERGGPDKLNIIPNQEPVSGTKGSQLKQRPLQQQQAYGPMFVEVEPGMRLRPAAGTTQQLQQRQQQQQQQRQLQQQQQGGLMSNMNNQANTVYMIMMNNPTASTTSLVQGNEMPSKKPITVIEMMPAPPNQLQQQQQRPRAEVAVGTKQRQSLQMISPGASSTTAMGANQPMTAATKSFSPPTRTGQFGASITTASSSLPSRTAGGQQTTLMRQTTPAVFGGVDEGPATTISMQSRGQQSARTGSQSPVQTTQAFSQPMTTTARPRLDRLMENAIEMDQSLIMRGGGGARPKDFNKMRKLEFEQTSSSMAPKSTATSREEQSIMTTTSSPAERFDSTTTSRLADDTIAPARASNPPTAPTTTQTPAPASTTTTTTTTTTAMITPTTTSPSSSSVDRMQVSSNRTTPQPISGEERPELIATVSPVRGEGGRNQIANVQFERIQHQQATSTPAPASRTSDRRPQQQRQQQQQQQPAVATKSSGKVNVGSSLSSSFIPSKLRTDFGGVNAGAAGNKLNWLATQPQQSGSLVQPAPVTSDKLVATGSKSHPEPGTNLAPMAQNMAIRQFGGANRMSVLANQPVPFGRPAAMTMQNGSHAQQRPTRVEVPIFEYGPSISVRRPDEPLANGQMPNCTLTGKNFCVLTKDYPMNEVRQAVERSFRSVRIMYEELQTVSDQELHKDLLNATSNQAASGQFACQTQVEMMRPGWAKDEITKEWMLIVNTDVFPQRVRTESCAQPNTPCEFIAPFYDSTCQQRYSLHRMIAIDPHDPSRSPQVAMFRFPAGCVCRVHPIKKTSTSQTLTMIQSTTTSITTPVPQAASI